MPEWLPGFVPDWYAYSSLFLFISTVPMLARSLREVFDPREQRHERIAGALWIPIVVFFCIFWPLLVLLLLLAMVDTFLPRRGATGPAGGAAA